MRDEVSWAKRVEEELWEPGFPLLDEPMKSSIVEIENRAQHWSRSEREDAERREIGDELRRGDRAHRPRSDALSDLFRERVEHVGVERALADLAYGFHEFGGAIWMLIELADHVRRCVGRLRQLLEIQPNDAPHFVLDVGVGAEDFTDAEKEALCDALEDGRGEPALASEVIVEKRFVDAGFVGDLLHPGAGRSASHEDEVGGVEDPRLGVGVALGYLAGGLNHLI